MDQDEVAVKVSPDFTGEALYKQEGYMQKSRERYHAYQARRAIPFCAWTAAISLMFPIQAKMIQVSRTTKGGVLSSAFAS